MKGVLRSRCRDCEQEHREEEEHPPRHRSCPGRTQESQDVPGRAPRDDQVMHQEGHPWYIFEGKPAGLNDRWPASSVTAGSEISR